MQDNGKAVENNILKSMGFFDYCSSMGAPLSQPLIPVLQNIESSVCCMVSTGLVLSNRGNVFVMMASSVQLCLMTIL